MDMNIGRTRLKNDVNVAAVVRTEGARTNLASQLEAIDGVIARTFTTAANKPVDWLQSFETADLIILEVNVQSAEELRILEELVRDSGGQSTVVATGADASVDDIRRLMRLGVADYIPQPFSVDDLKACIAQARSRRIQRTPIMPVQAGRVVSFIGARGGMGTTTLAVQTACALHVGDGKKSREKSVCLVDLDVQAGHAALCLDIDAGHGILDLIQEDPERIDESFLKGATSTHKIGIDVIAAPKQVVTLDSITPPFVERVLDVARQSYDYVVVDLPFAWTDWKLQAIQCSDQVVLVTQMTVPALRGARQQIDLLQEEQMGVIPLAVVVNRYAKGYSRVSRAEAEHALGRPIDMFIRNDFKTVSLALDRGVPIAQVSSWNRVGKDIVKMIKGLKTLQPESVR